MSIGHRIRSIRVARGLSQTKLAKTIGVTQGALSQIEVGFVKALKAETLVRLSAALQTNPHWIQTGRGSPVLEIVDDLDEAEAVTIYRAMSAPNRSAWLAAGRALLDSQPQATAAKPYSLPKSRQRG